MKHLFRIALTAAIVFSFAQTSFAQARTWNSDPVHSGVSYIVRHAMTPMQGYFKSFAVTIKWDEENLAESSIQGTLDPKSVFMGNDGLSEHLHGEDFFATDQFTEWSFVSKKIEEDDGKYVAVGDLTVRGETQQMAIPFEFLGSMETRRGMKSAFLAEFAMDRTAFGIKYDPEGNNVGKTVRVRVSLEMNSK